MKLTRRQFLLQAAAAAITTAAGWAVTGVRVEDTPAPPELEYYVYDDFSDPNGTAATPGDSGGFDLTTHFFDDKQDGDLITQIEHWEWADLLAQTFDESVEPLDLVDSDIKRERVLGRKLACLMQLASGDMAAFLTLPKTDWVTLYFRKRGIDGIEAELLQRGNSP